MKRPARLIGETARRREPPAVVRAIDRRPAQLWGGGSVHWPAPERLCRPSSWLDAGCRPSPQRIPLQEPYYGRKSPRPPASWSIKRPLNGPRRTSNERTKHSASATRRLHRRNLRSVLRSAARPDPRHNRRSRSRGVSLRAAGPILRGKGPSPRKLTESLLPRRTPRCERDEQLPGPRSIR